MHALADTASWSAAGVVASLVTHAIGPVALGYLADRSGRRTGVFGPSRRRWWWIGWTAAVVAVSPPVDALAHASFLWHMIQHLVLVLVSAPALLAARPDLLLVRALPRRIRPRVGRLLAAALPHGWLAPAVAVGAFVGWLWVTHLTSIYERSLSSPLLHGTEHLLYVLTAMAFWVPFVLAAPRSELRRIVTPMAVTLVAMPATSTLAFVLLNATDPRYAAYSLADQRAGAAAMWIGMAAAMVAAVLIAVGRALPRPTTGDGLEPPRARRPGPRPSSSLPGS